MFKVESVPGFPDVKTIATNTFRDQRGYFCEAFRNTIPGLPEFVQENVSFSKIRTVRGLHYQLKPKAQAKLISCIHGYIIDIFLDLRKDSPTYGKHGKVELYGPEVSLFIPEGFAHGFCAWASDTVVKYKVSEFYSPDHERSIRYNDPDLDITWHCGFIESYVMSDKDRDAPLFKDAENNF